MRPFSRSPSYETHWTSSIELGFFNMFANLSARMVGTFIPPSHQSAKLNAVSSFKLYPSSEEYDLRMTYCAFAICSMLDDWSAINLDKAVRFITSCRASALLRLFTSHNDGKLGIRRRIWPRAAQRSAWWVIPG